MPPPHDHREQPFTDPAVVPSLYADRDRVSRRSSALLSAKIHGSHVGRTAADLLDSAAPDLATPQLGATPLLADIGCGNGRPTHALLNRFPHLRILAIDASAAMLREAREHLTAKRPHRNELLYVQGDFHQLPLADHVLDAATAIFCLYHSTRPADAIAEIARTLKPAGTALLITKSADSYRELDQLLAHTGLDTDATRRPSLYASANSANLPTLTATALDVTTVLHDRHVFRFRDANHLADYLTTIPKYHLGHLQGAPEALAAELRHRRGDGPTTATSTITYVLARRRSP
ncbi:class I SAM-dependent methyltransferase [Actinomadura fibrosa]|uniref:Class I SAM-dependent methyltransferase n=1 Tax=Actinomadura fibrosa TaxID=111802 RepID=A0ABW2XH58_9ACTN|nr:class I SAM-dependent methyltransferase [Actinomadura fibrosa]